MTRAVILLMAFAIFACEAEGPTSTPSSVSASESAQAQSEVIAVGSQAPQFELPGSDGATHRLSGYAGQHVVLAFFPKAFTGG